MPGQGHSKHSGENEEGHRREQVLFAGGFQKKTVRHQLCHEVADELAIHCVSRPSAAEIRDQ